MAPKATVGAASEFRQLSGRRGAVLPDGILADVFAVLVTGPPGSGKTAVLTAMLDALAMDGLSHAGVDVDEVAWAFPFPNLSQRCDHAVLKGVHLVFDSDLTTPTEIAESVRAARSDLLSAPNPPPGEGGC